MTDTNISKTLPTIVLLLAAAGAFGAGGFLLGKKMYAANNAQPAASCEQTDACAEEAAHDAHGHDEDSHDDHGHAAEAVHLEDLESVTCEHATAIVDCDECRYEVGVVKIDPAIAGALIETGQTEMKDRSRTLQFTGQVELDPTRTVDVVSVGSGRVEQVERYLGEQVQKGDVLAVIHSDDLGQAKADFLEVQAAVELAKTTYDREKDLYEKKISSQADYLAAQNALKAAQAAYAAADKKLRLFGLSTEQIRDIQQEEQNGGFSNLILRAPQSGTIIAQAVSTGQLVDTSDNLYTIADLSRVWVWSDVYEKDLAALHEYSAKAEPLQAGVTVQSYPSAVFDGTVDFVGPLMDEHTRTVKMRVRVQNPDGRLRPGMFAHVEVALPVSGRFLAVPQTAVMSDEGETFVFQHWKDDFWVRRDVAVGQTYGSAVEILDGVPAGAEVVTGGAFMLKSDILREKMGAGCAD